MEKRKGTILKMVFSKNVFQRLSYKILIGKHRYINI